MPVAVVRSRSREAVGIALAVTAAISFGTLGIFGKLGYSAGARPFSLLAVRFAVATVLLVLFHVATRRPLWVGPGPALRLLALGGLGYGLEASLFFLALDRAPAGIVGLIFYSYPMWTYLLGYVTGLEPFRGRVLVALVLGSLGVVTISTVKTAGTAGVILALAAALAVAVYFLLAQIVLRETTPAASALWTGAGAGLSVGVVALVLGEPFPAGAIVPASALGAASAFSFLLLYAAITRIGSTRSAIANMVEPVTTVVLAAIFLGEVITARVALGAVLVVSALPILATAGEPAPADSA